MSEPVTVLGNSYRLGRLNAMQQVHVARRVAPFMRVFVESRETLRAARSAENPEAEPNMHVVLDALGPVTEVLAQMSDEDVEHIVNTCLGVVSRQQGEGPASRWVPVKARAGNELMFADMDFNVVLRLVWEVVQENMGGFFLGLGGSASPTAAPAP